MEHQTLADLEDVFNVNIKGVLRLTQKWLPTLRQGQGRIVMVSSVAGFMVIPRASAYCASKHALEAFTDGLRVRGAWFCVPLATALRCLYVFQIMIVHCSTDPTNINSLALHCIAWSVCFQIMIVHCSIDQPHNPTPHTKPQMELSKYNVSVTSVQPGAVQSAIFDKALEHGKAHLEEHPGETAVYGHLIKGKDVSTNTNASSHVM